MIAYFFFDDFLLLPPAFLDEAFEPPFLAAMSDSPPFMPYGTSRSRFLA